jgi:putative PIN family toxin of toxin-antitoxin system
MTRVVLDTNVVVSAHLNEAGSESAVLKLAFAGHLTLFVSEPILTEYEGVLLRRKFSLDAHRIRCSLARIREASTVVQPLRTVWVSSDEADNRFLECAETAQADYLVTGNKRHFPRRWKSTQIVSARELILKIVPTPI